MDSITTQLEDLSDSKLDALSELVNSRGWQDTEALMPFTHTMAILRNLIVVLREADRTELLAAIPTTLQNDIFQTLTNIRLSINSTLNEDNQINDIADQTDKLNLAVCQSGLRFSLTGVPDSITLQQLNYKLTYEVERLKEREKSTKKLVKEIANMYTAMHQKLQDLNISATNVEQSIEEVKDITAKAKDANNDLQNKIQAINSKVTEASESASLAEAKAQAATINESRLQDFIKRVDENEARLRESLTKLSQELDENKSKFQSLIDSSASDIETFKNTKTKELDEFEARLKVIEEDIKKKLVESTGISLFNAFDIRFKKIYGHWVWLVVAILAIIITFSYTAILIHQNHSANAVFFIKLSLGIPTLALTVFAMQQYNKERRLKEEYAFKSTIALSLAPYKDLVEEAAKMLSPEDKTKFADFLISSINTIFETPTERVFGSRRTPGPSDSKVIAKAIQMLKDVKELLN